LGHHEVNRDRQERREKSGQCVVHTTVALDLNDLVNQESNKVHPRKSGGEAEARDDRVEGLRFKFLSDQGDSVNRLLHCIL